METPHVHLLQPLRYPIITVIWWVGIWGLSETLLTLFFKEKIIFKLSFYISLIILVILLIAMDPTIADRL
jgi:hypothetical protein